MSRKPLLGLVALLAFTAWVYAPVRTFEFVTWDDEPYVTQNPHVLGGLSLAGLRWAAGAQVPYWHPLTWLSHMLDVQMFGPDAGAHHVVNVLLHLTNTVVLFWLLNRLTSRPWPSLMVAALFAVHPLHVESVAWVAERKDLLSSFFAMLAMGAYARYVTAPSRRAYSVLFLSFAASLMSKPMFVTLPVLLLLLDWWPLQRPIHRGLVTEKLPLLAVSVAVSLATYIAQQDVGTMAGLAHLPFADRLANAAIAYVKYLRKAVWPVDLAAFYPYPEVPPSGGLIAVSVVALLALSAGVWVSRRSRYPVVGWLWFLVVLLPVIGLVQVGNQAWADRFAYMSLVGVSIVAVWGFSDLAGRFRIGRAAVGAIATAVILLLGVTSRAQVMTWSNSESLWSQVVLVTPDSFYAHSALGVELARRDDLAGARREQEEALRLRPNDPDANNELGILLVRAGDLDLGLDRFKRALLSNPGFEEARKNLARAHFDRGSRLGGNNDLAGALVDFEAALAADGTRPEYHVGAALALLSLGRPQEAAVHVRTAIALDPADERPKQLLARIEGVQR